MEAVVMLPEEMIALVNAGDGHGFEIESGPNGENVATAICNDPGYVIETRVDEATGRVDVTRYELNRYGEKVAA